MKSGTECVTVSSFSHDQLRSAGFFHSSCLLCINWAVTGRERNAVVWQDWLASGDLQIWESFEEAERSFLFFRVSQNRRYGHLMKVVQFIYIMLKNREKHLFHQSIFTNNGKEKFHIYEETNLHQIQIRTQTWSFLFRGRGEKRKGPTIS